MKYKSSKIMLVLEMHSGLNSAFIVIAINYFQNPIPQHT